MFYIVLVREGTRTPPKVPGPTVVELIQLHQCNLILMIVRSLTSFYLLTQGLVFKDICVDVAEKRILWSVSGQARPGHVLAILGPSGESRVSSNVVLMTGMLSNLGALHVNSIFPPMVGLSKPVLVKHLLNHVLVHAGSGKTTLLNTLAGHVKKTSGTVTLNGHKITKKNRRKMSYVLQADIFFPNLTLRETIRVRCFVLTLYAG